MANPIFQEVVRRALRRRRSVQPQFTASKASTQIKANGPKSGWLSLLGLGMMGVLLSITCLLTPLVAALLDIAGLSWRVGYLEYLLFPALFVLFSLIVYAWWRR